MKKLLFLAAMSFATIGTTISCSSDRDEEPTVQPEKKDFTNAEYIKTTLQGTWKQTAWSYNNTAWNNSSSGFQPFFTFTGNKYTYKNSETSDMFTENGTYAITPVIGNTNASLKMNYTYDNNPRTYTITLLDYTNNVVTVSEVNIGSPTGMYYTKFKKQ